MKVVALGGAGAIGRAAVELIATFGEVTELVIADRRVEPARAFADAISRPGLRTSATAVSILDPPDLHRLLADADAVVNTAGPFFRLGVAALQAAIATGTHYLDICDDPQPTRDLLVLHADAARAGVTAIIGMGASPGLSNLLAVCVAEQLDLVEDLYTAWPVDAGDTRSADSAGTDSAGTDRAGTDRAEMTGPDGAPSAAVVHWLEQLHGTVPVSRSGQPEQMRPLTPIRLGYPGRRPGAGYVVGHPEPLTLGPNLAVRGTTACLMILTRGTAAYLDRIRRDLDRGRLTSAEAAALVVRPSSRRQWDAALHALRLPGPGGLPPFFALATGFRNGVATTVAAQLAGLPGAMSTVTGVPLALALREVLGGLRRPGAHPPELVLDARRLLTVLADVPAMQHNGAAPELRVSSSP